MSTVIGLSIRYFKKNKKQSLTIIIAVGLASILFFSVGILFSSFREYLIDKVIENNDYHVKIIGDVSFEKNMTSLKENNEIIAITQTFFPSVVMWTNYVYVFESFDFGQYMLNTIVVAVFSTIGTLITTIIAAFAFARLQFKGRDSLFLVFLMTMMIPGEMMVISNYITVASFGWIGNDQTIYEAYAAMIVPFWISVFYIYLLRQNFKQIPNELYLAAKVDGKSDWSFLWKVMVPLALPTLISITILKFMGTWNSYVWPNLVTNDSTYRLISNGLRGSAFQDADTGRISYGYQMAATVLVTVPLFLLFVFFRKYIMRGVGRAGIKG